MKEEQVRSLLVWVAVATTALILSVIMIIIILMTRKMITVMVATTALMMIFIISMMRTIFMVKRPAPQLVARPGDFVLFLLGILMFT